MAPEKSVALYPGLDDSGSSDPERRPVRGVLSEPDPATLRSWSMLGRRTRRGQRTNPTSWLARSPHRGRWMLARRACGQSQQLLTPRSHRHVHVVSGQSYPPRRRRPNIAQNLLGNFQRFTGPATGRCGHRDDPLWMPGRISVEERIESPLAAAGVALLPQPNVVPSVLRVNDSLRR